MPSLLVCRGPGHRRAEVIPGALVFFLALVDVCAGTSPSRAELVCFPYLGATSRATSRRRSKEEVYGAWFGASLTPASSKCGIRVVAACMICKRLLPAYGGRITATVYAPRYGTVIRPEPSELLVPSRVVSPDNGQGLGPSYSSRVYRIRPDYTFLPS